MATEAAKEIAKTAKHTSASLHAQVTHVNLFGVSYLWIRYNFLDLDKYIFN